MSELATQLRSHATFYASFLEGHDADRSGGDPRGRLQPAVARHDPQGGRFGGGLVFAARDYGWVEDECTFAAEGNFPYRDRAFGGTIALWLRTDPDADLAPAVPVDPFHISRHPSDGSFYLDLTRPNDDRYGSPRKLRFGFYPDSPLQNRLVGGQLLVVGELNWRRDAWHHVAATWENANSGAADGRAALYIDGARRSSMEGYAHRLTWDLAKLKIGLGQRFVGGICEVLVLDRPLAADEVAELAALDRPLREGM